MRRAYRGETLETRRRNQHDRLIEAAREVFADRGFAAASIEDIVAAARVSRTSFYRCFENKEACLLAVFDVAMERLRAVLVGVAGSSMPPEQMIRAGVREFVSALASDPAMARTVLVEVVGATPAVEAERVRVRGAFADLLAAQMRSYDPWRRRPRREVDLVALATIGGIAESVCHLVVAGDLAEWPTLVQPLGSWAVRALTGEPELGPGPTSRNGPHRVPSERGGSR